MNDELEFSSPKFPILLLIDKYVKHIVVSMQELKKQLDDQLVTTDSLDSKNMAAIEHREKVWFDSLSLCIFITHMYVCVLTYICL